MIRRALPGLATLTLLFAASPADAMKSTPKAEPLPRIAPVTGFERPDAEELLQEAEHLWRVKQDYTGALAKFNAAVEADPSDPDTRLQRARYFEMLSDIVVPGDKAKFEARAKNDYEQIAAADPDSLIAGVARDGLTRLAGERLLGVKRVVCPIPAAGIHAHADTLYALRRFADAAVEYEKATAGCPADANWWVDFADSHYMQEDYGKAKELFTQALAVDPWNREAHRFLSDTEVQLNNLEAAVHQLVLAVVSDPVYEAGWASLREYVDALGQKWNRVYAERKTVSGGGDEAPWAAYGAAKANARDAQPEPASALAIERKAVTSALKTVRASGEGSARAPGPFWSMMARADDAGFLDEAIFLHMLDAPLAAEYPAFREKNAERLAAYLETVILP